MNLRLRLIISFFALSVVPVAALTLYNYTSNARATREAAGREAELLAGELTQRMQLVTTQLSKGIEHLMDLETASQNALVAAESASSAAEAQAQSASQDRYAQQLGELAMLLNNVDVRPARGGGRGRGGGGPGGRGGGRGPNAGPAGGGGQAAASAASPGSTVAPFNGERRGGGGRPFPPDPNAPAGSGRAEGAGGAPDFAAQAAGANRGSGTPSSDVGGRRSGGGPGGPPDLTALDPNQIRIDLTPIRLEILRQFVPTPADWDKLTPERQAEINKEITQRLLGVEKGIEVAKVETQKRIVEAQRAADAKAKQVAAAARAQTAQANAAEQAVRSAEPGNNVPEATSPTGRTSRRTAITGSRVEFTETQNGEVVNQINAEIDLRNLLATVFSATRRDRGEVPFAVGKDGQLFTSSDEADRKTITALGGTFAKPETPSGTVVIGDWVVVTTADPTGAGLKFGVARPLGDLLNELRRTTARNSAFGLGFIALALIGIVPLSSRLTRNLSTLSDGVRRIAGGDYSARVHVKAHDEIGQLAGAFNQMAADVEQHQHDIVERERLKRELELGRQIQHDMLPRTALRLGLTDIKGVSVPANEVGGDFFNYFELPNGEVALLVGDVSGKGVGAALLMANIQASLRTRLALGQDLAVLAREIDGDIDSNTPRPVYATLFVGILNPITRVLRYVNAGHNPQYALRTTGDLERMPSTGMPVGMLAGHGYQEQTLGLAPGDLLFFYTDGCVEAENPAGDMFGVERLEALLISAARSQADDLLARVETDVAKFRAGREPYDDATMMAVRVG